MELSDTFKEKHSLLSSGSAGGKRKNIFSTMAGGKETTGKYCYQSAASLVWMALAAGIR